MDFDNVQTWANYDSSVDCPISAEDFTEQEGPWNDIEFMISRYQEAGKTLHDIRNDPYGYTATGEDTTDEDNPVPRYGLDPTDIAASIARNEGKRANSRKTTQVDPAQANPIPPVQTAYTTPAAPQNQSTTAAPTAAAPQNQPTKTAAPTP